MISVSHMNILREHQLTARIVAIETNSGDTVAQDISVHALEKKMVVLDQVLKEKAKKRGCFGVPIRKVLVLIFIWK